MSTRVFRAGRRPTAIAATYVGEYGSLFYDEAIGYLRLSDGVTPGGLDAYPISTSSTRGMIKPGPSFTVAGDGTLNLKAGTSTTIGGIKAGPGVVVASDGTLSLDSTGIPFNFGDFYAFTNEGAQDGACISSIHSNQDINIVSNGTGTVNLIGEFKVHKASDTLEDALEATPIFKVAADGQVRMYVTQEDSNLGAFEIIGSSTGNIIAPGDSGGMLHVTGQLGNSNRIYFDGNGGYVSLVSRRWNGNIAVPTQVLAGQDVFRINATAATNVGIGNVAMAQMRMTAAEDQTSTAQGSRIEFWTTAIGTIASNRVQVSNITVENGVTATKFTGPLLQNGNSNVSITANANVSVFVAGNTTARAVFTATGANIAGTANITGNANIGNIGTGTIIATTANLTTINSGLVQNGTSNVTVNSSGNVNISVGGNVLTVTSTGANIAGTANVSGNANVGNLGTAGLIVATGNVTGGNLVTTGVVSAPSVVNGNSNVAIAPNGNVSISAIGTSNVLVVTATGANITGTANISTNLFVQANANVGGNLNVVGNANVGNVGAAAGTYSGNVSAGNLSTGGVLSVTGNANIGNIGTGTIIATTANLTTINSGLVQNGTSNVTVNNNGNVNVSVAGNANILTVTGTGIAVSGSMSDSIGNVRSVPINSQSGAYILGATDNGKMIDITTGGVTVPASVFVSPYGQIVSIYNDSTNSQTITQGSGVTLRLAGTATTGNRTLARYGVATITCVAANTFVISGAGLT